MTDYIGLIVFVAISVIIMYFSRWHDTARRAELGVEPESAVLAYKKLVIFIVIAAIFARPAKSIVYDIIILAVLAVSLIEDIVLYYLCSEEVTARYIGHYSYGGRRRTKYYLAFEYESDFKIVRSIPVNSSLLSRYVIPNEGDEVTLHIMPMHPKVCMFRKRFPWWSIVSEAVIVLIVLSNRL